MRQAGLGIGRSVLHGDGAQTGRAGGRSEGNKRGAVRAETGRPIRMMEGFGRRIKGCEAGSRDEQNL